MGPKEGKKRTKAEKKVDQNALASASLRSHNLHDEPWDWWDDFSKRITGPLSQSGDSKNFDSVFKISRKTFNYICSLVKDDVMSRPSKFSDTTGKPLSLNDRVAVALRRFSSGESFKSIGHSFGIGRNVVSRITWWFVEAMEDKWLHHLQWPSTEEKIEDIKSNFEKLYGLPNCCGAIGTTHIIMHLHKKDPLIDIWLDRENNYSMILQAIVDTKMRFLDIVTGWPGRLRDSDVLKRSNFFKLCQKGKRLNGNKQKLSVGKELREYIIGETSFPLLPWLLTPYQGIDNNIQAKFNKRHLATQMVAQRALARLKELWRILQGEICLPDKDKLPRIIFVCCLLHNIVIDLDDDVQDELPLSHCHESGYSKQICEYVDNTASDQRENLSLHLFGQTTP